MLTVPLPVCQAAGGHALRTGGASNFDGEIILRTNLKYKPVKGQPFTEPFITHLWWPSALLDLGYTMLMKCKLLDKLKQSSFEVCNPFSYFTVNDQNRFYTVWNGFLTVFPLASGPLFEGCTLLYRFNGMIIPSPSKSNPYQAFLCYLLAVISGFFTGMAG